MPTYKNLRAGGLQLDPKVKTNANGVRSFAEARIIPPGSEFVADESEVPVSWLGTDTHPQFVELVSMTAKKVLASALDNDVPPAAVKVSSEALDPESKPPVDPVGRTVSAGRSPSPEQLAAAAKAEADADKEKIDQITKTAATSQKADKAGK